MGLDGDVEARLLVILADTRSVLADLTRGILPNIGHDFDSTIISIICKFLGIGLGICSCTSGELVIIIYF